MENYKAYQSLISIKEGFGNKIKELMQREFMSVIELYGPFNEVYPALAAVFASLPPFELLKGVVESRDNTILKRWYKAQLEWEERSAGFNDAACRAVIDNSEIVFTTPTSERVITLDLSDSTCTTTIDFRRPSCYAAESVIKIIKYTHPHTRAMYSANHKYIYSVAHVVLSRYDVLHARDMLGEEMTPLEREEYWGISSSCGSSASSALLLHTPKFMGGML